MRLKNITATPHPAGNRIDLKWEHPYPDQYPDIRVVRREGTHPTSPEPDPSPAAGVVVAEGEELDYTENEDGVRVYEVTDENLKGETVYYYALFPYRGDPREYQIDRHHRTAAIATAPYNFAGQMYDLLPAIYHRYDTVLPKTIPDEMPDADRERGQLRRFLELPGGKLDQVYSFARAMLDLYNIDKVDGRLLPLLADWIAWETDYNLEIDAQRNELRNAPSIYQRVGIIPTAEATVKRIIGWENRTKEFAHNVFLSNRPERLNIWARHRSSPSEWSEPTDPLSLDFAYEGRPTAIRDGDGLLWLFYHTLKKGRWDIWYKTLSAFSIPLVFQGDLDNGVVSTGLQGAFEAEGHSLSQNATIEKKDSIWLITDADDGEPYTVREEAGQFNVYRWTTSQPFTNRKLIDKHPTAAAQGNTLWVFWGVYDETDGTWRIDYRTQNDGQWSRIATFPLLFSTHSQFSSDLDSEMIPEDLRQAFEENETSLSDNVTVSIEDEKSKWLIIDEDNGQTYAIKLEEDQLNIYIFADLEIERRQPQAVVDNTGGLWLFWLGKVGARWELKYNRHDGTAWELDPAASFPLDGADAPRVESDLSVLFNSTDSTLWVFWARKGEPGATRWEIAYRVKVGIDPNDDSDWSIIRTLPKDPLDADYHDREPSALIDASGNIELFWSSNRSGSWSIWRSTLLDIDTNTWESAEQITNNPYSQRTPLPLSGFDEVTLLIYRSNESLSYTSEVYGATETVDFRYAGSTTADTGNGAKIALRGQFDDFQTYTYDVGQNGKRTSLDWYALDTVGIFLVPDTDDQQLRIRKQNRIQNILKQFLPIQVRAVLILQDVYNEAVYTYDQPEAEPQRLIREQMIDTILSEVYRGLEDSHLDSVNFRWLRTWEVGGPGSILPDLSVASPDLSFRLFLKGVEEGEGE